MLTHSERLREKEILTLKCHILSEFMIPFNYGIFILGESHLSCKYKTWACQNRSDAISSAWCHPCGEDVCNKQGTFEDIKRKMGIQDFRGHLEFIYFTQYPLTLMCDQNISIFEPALIGWRQCVISHKLIRHGHPSRKIDSNPTANALLPVGIWRSWFSIDCECPRQRRKSQVSLSHARKKMTSK